MELFAYLDAGTGSIIIQAIIGAVVGVGIFLKAFWGRITGFFKRGGSPTEQPKTKTSKPTKANG